MKCACTFGTRDSICGEAAKVAHLGMVLQPFDKDLVFAIHLESALL